MSLEHAKRQCFAYKDGDCEALEGVETCKDCRFYKSIGQMKKEKTRSAVRNESRQIEEGRTPLRDCNTKGI